MSHNIPTTPGPLFSSSNLEYWLTEYRERVSTAVEQLDANRLLNTAPEDLVTYLVELASVETITLRREDWSVDIEEVQVDVRYDSRRFIVTDP